MKTTTNHGAVALIAKCEPFKNGTGSFRGVNGSSWMGAGHLPEMFQRSHLYSAEYVVFSYDTPIAWRYRGRWYYPSVNYSLTTTQHQHTVRVAMTGKPCYLGGDWRKAKAKRAYGGFGSMRVPASTGSQGDW